MQIIEVNKEYEHKIQLSLKLDYVRENLHDLISNIIEGLNLLF